MYHTAPNFNKGSTNELGLAMLAMRSTAEFNMFLFRRHCGIIFPKPKPYILLDTAFLINYISHPRMMTCVKIDASIILDAKYDQRLKE